MKDDCDVNANNPDGIQKPCNCGEHLSHCCRKPMIRNATGFLECPCTYFAVTEKFRALVEGILNTFPEVAWDRFTGDRSGLCVYGWIDRPDAYKDFLILKFFGDTVWFATSSARFSKEFSERFGATDHKPCHLVEERFRNIRIVKR